MSKFEDGYVSGYQAAMRDIAGKLNEGGATAVRQWVADNVRPDASGTVDDMETERDDYSDGFGNRFREIGEVQA